MFIQLRSILPHNTCISRSPSLGNQSSINMFVIQDIFKYILLKYFHLEWKFCDQFIAYRYNFHKNPQKLNFEERKILLQCILFHILTLCAALVILNLCILEFVIKALVYFRGPWENVLILWQFLIFYWFKSQLSPT